jgi:hypothetical protein
MFRKAYFTSLGGRLATATASLAVLGAGLVALHGGDSEVIISLTTLLTILGAILTVGFSLTSYWREAWAFVLGLPLLGFHYLAMTYLVHAGSLVGVGLVVLAMLPLTETLFARTPDRAREPQAALG